MTPQQIAGAVTEHIVNSAASAQTITQYRKPLVSWTRADNPLFTHLKEAIIPEHLLPCVLLPDAESVIAFFLPFSEDIVKDNRRSRTCVAESWARAYLETNTLISRTIVELKGVLASYGIETAFQPPTHNFDEQTLTCSWSHKSIAYITGLGSFGLHRMIITDQGCAGRIGSFVIDAPLPERSRVEKLRCSYFVNGSCRACVVRCPIGALSMDGEIEKQRCYARLLDTAEDYTDLGSADVCGKCAVGPCALTSAT